MLTPKFRKSPAAERIRRLLHTCVGSLKIPRKGGRHVLIEVPTKPTALCRGLFLRGARAYPMGPPARPQRLAGERRSDRMSEPCRLRRGEGYGVRDDEAPRSCCSRRSRHGRQALSRVQARARRAAACCVALAALARLQAEQCFFRGTCPRKKQNFV